MTTGGLVTALDLSYGSSISGHYSFIDSEFSLVLREGSDVTGLDEPKLGLTAVLVYSDTETYTLRLDILVDDVIVDSVSCTHRVDNTPTISAGIEFGDPNFTSKSESELFRPLIFSYDYKGKPFTEDQPPFKIILDGKEYDAKELSQGAE